MNILIYGKAGIGRTSIVQEYLNRQAEKEEQKDYFKNKWENIPYVEKYIDLLLKYDMPSRTIDSCLGYIAYNLDPIFMATRVGVDITKQLYELKNETPYKYGKHAKEVK